MLTVGGWFDAEDLFGALETYRSIESQSPGTANRLVMGPWPHGGWSRGTGDALGKVTFGQPTSKFFEEQIELPFFRYYLKGGDDPKLPEAYVFETGANAWHTLDAWPPREARPARPLPLRERPALPGVALRDGGGLRRVRLRPGQARALHRGRRRRHGREYMVADQRFAGAPAGRPRVQTEPLEEDLTVAGPITASLSVSTTGTDADWVVKLIDVYPDDYPLQPERGGRRPRPAGPLEDGRLRAARARRAVPRQVPEELREAGALRRRGRSTTVEFTMPDVFHTFRRGHRIMVQVQSSWFPLVNLNPQTFVDINEATEADFKKATQRVWRTKDRPSLVRLNVVGN